jgi:DNA modification methylase
MAAKRNFDKNSFLSLLSNEPLSTGIIARKIRCDKVTALKYLRELKAEKIVVETRINHKTNVWQLNFENQILIGDCATTLRNIETESVDLIVTDPPYGYNFMNLNWDKALPSLEALKECCRVLKSGAFAFFMCSSRTDLLWRMGERLEKAGFETGFSNISWVYSTGFPKSANVSKLLNKRADSEKYEAEDFKGSFAGNQLKPAMEHILVCMKPLSAKTFLDQALKNGKGITWLDDCRIPYANDADIPNNTVLYSDNVKFHENRLGRPWSDERVANGLPTQIYNPDENGRFPANLLVCDDALNNGIINRGNNKPSARVAGAGALGQNKGWNKHENKPTVHVTVNDSGSYSRFFDLDAWFKSRLPMEAEKTFPCLVVPKPAKSEKNKYAENTHPTVKPLKLMSYLITMGSREGDLVLDPFAGSGTTLEAANILKRRFIGCELDPRYKDLIEARAFMGKAGATET